MFDLLEFQSPAAARAGRVLALVMAFAGTAAYAQSIVNPGAEAAKSDAKNREAEADTAQRQSSYNMPAINIVGKPLPKFKDDELIGDYAQPRWTAQRLFSGTRTYVIPNGVMDFEQWWRFETPKDKSQPTHLTTQSELEFGLPHHLQIDLYLNTGHDIGSSGPGSSGFSGEVRWALDDWGKIWGNPTLYLEYTSNSGSPDLIEAKLLLGDALAPGWHWGVNFSVEQQISGQRTTEKQFTAGISNSTIDHKLELGVETRLGWTSAAGSRGHNERDLQIGPSIRWTPVKQMHLDFAPLFGLTSESMKLNAYVILGWEF